MTLGEIAAHARSPDSLLTAYVSWCIQPPAAVRRTFNPQPKLVLIYRSRNDNRLSWPE